MWGQYIRPGEHNNYHDPYSRVAKVLHLELPNIDGVVAYKNGEGHVRSPWHH